MDFPCSFAASDPLCLEWEYLGWEKRLPHFTGEGTRPGELRGIAVPSISQGNRHLPVSRQRLLLPSKGAAAGLGSKGIWSSPDIIFLDQT